MFDVRCFPTPRCNDMDTVVFAGFRFKSTENPACKTLIRNTITLNPTKSHYKKIESSLHMNAVNSFPFFALTPVAGMAHFSAVRTKPTCRINSIPMPPIIHCRTAALLSFAIAISILTSGCGVTLSPVKRAPLEISSVNTPVAPQPDKVLVRFENTLPNGPLAETVWDNGSAGPFIDPKESQQIGFTQNYKEMLPAAVAGGAAAGAAVATRPEYTRIVIPFGRLFEGVFQSGIQKAFPNASICPDETCATTGTPTPVIKLKVKEFRVWESPLNHINLAATVELRVYRGNMGSPQTYIMQHEVDRQSLGSVMSTSSGFIRAMNKISNDFAATLSEQILEKLKF
jgi:hypothetical protein